jgi:hypothetical protein
MLAAFHVGHRWGGGDADETDGAADPQAYEVAAKVFIVVK